MGYTARHHTFFEMLGNFSFGDYFKETAIEHAWKLLTQDYGISPEKLSFTLYHTDDEAFTLWKKITGCHDSKILRIPTKDNFWAMGDTGPCGPCSEIFYDHGVGNGEWALNADGSDKFDARFVEIWNLVFMQYEQVDANTRIDLPKPSIDTGMGLERISAVMQGKHDNYDIDLFQHIIRAIKTEAAKLGAAPSPIEPPYKVLADHLRSTCFLMADGVLPSNEGRGYVLRRIMRRAMRYAHQLGCKEPLMYRLVPSLIEQMGGQYPELGRAQGMITENLKQEEERFKQTLERGLKLLDEESANLSKGQKLSGDAAFKLYDTFGFPLDLTQDILRGRGLEVDTDGFETCMEGQRDMARAAHKGSGDATTDRVWFAVKEKVGATQFLGYEDDVAQAKVIALVKAGAMVDAAGAGDDVFIVLDKTPFYGESGGQVGDTGSFDIGGKKVAEIFDTQKPLDDFIVHKAKLSAALKLGDAVHAAIDAARRNATRAHHSATHLLHKALRDKLGAHVTQKGSLVGPDKLRFDFSHTKAVTREEIADIEQQVNAVVWKASPVSTTVATPDEAIAAGAMALFGEKYGDKVRVLAMGDADGKHYSVELCGGTHVKNTGDIGLFKITSEGSVASGIRRMEAVTGDAVRGYFIEQLTALREQLEKVTQENAQLAEGIAAAGGKAPVAAPKLLPLPLEQIKTAKPQDVLALYATLTQAEQEATTRMQDENKKLSKQLAELRKQQALAAGGDVRAEKVGNVLFIGKAFDGLDPKELRPLVENFRKEADVVALGTAVEGKASIVVAVKNPSDALSAVTLVQAAVAELGGKGGGGKPDMAQGGGPDAAKLESAVALVKAKIA
ncbi:MAG: alanine--tRNA ligase [Proteobacteria bacterium]|nr:alanine--tRNA ligase [Pseudomonadota bacterium]